MTETESVLDQLSVRSAQLYSLPGVAMQVLQLTRDPHVDTRALKECIENDPAIASRVLRVVNSSLFGLSREVSDLGQAIPMLGIKPLKLLVLGFSLPSGLFLDVESKTLMWYWKHTLTKAVAGRVLSQRRGAYRATTPSWPDCSRTSARSCSSSSLASRMPAFSIGW